jgi:hypothetical protein
MSTVLHILRKDVRRHALWLVVWLGVCASPLAVLALPDNAVVGRVAINMASPAIRLVVFLLLGRWSSTETLVDSTAFWLTRPIGGQALLWASSSSSCSCPPVMAADVALVAATGLASRHLWLAVPEIALEWTLWASGMFMLAALTSTFRGLLGAALRIALLWFGMKLFLLLVLPYLLHPELYYPRVTLALWFGLMDDVGGFERVPTLVASRTIGVDPPGCSRRDGSPLFYASDRPRGDDLRRGRRCTAIRSNGAGTSSDTRRASRRPSPPRTGCGQHATLHRVDDVRPPRRPPVRVTSERGTGVS